MGLVLSLIGLLCMLAGAVCGIIILIAAFQDEVLQGILCLCVPVYILYYGIARYQSEKKGLILAIWLGGLIVGVILNSAGAAMTAGQ